MLNLKIRAINTSFRAIKQKKNFLLKFFFLYYSFILNSNINFITVVGASINTAPIANPHTADFKSLFLSAVVDVTATIPAINMAANKNATPNHCIYPKYLSSYLIYLTICSFSWF